MRRLSLAVVVAALLLASCVYPAYSAYPTTITTAPSFDRSWDAALGAAHDAGVEVTNADRSTGHITGSKAGAAVTIDLRQQADSTLQVIFSAPDAQESNPSLRDRWLSAYNYRMGR